MKSLGVLLLLACCNHTFGQCFSDSNYVSGNYTRTAACADFNNDGKIDIASSGQPYTNLYIFTGNGTGYFSPGIIADTISGESMIAKDFDADGNADIAIIPGAWGPVLILWGNGALTFPTTTTVNFANGIEDVCTDDFNGDGKPDLASANNNSITVYINNGNRNFTNTNFSNNKTAMNITTGDINGDGSKDIIFSGNDGVDSIYVMIGNGAGNFSAAVGYSLGINGNLRNNISCADFNSDGYDDVALNEISPGVFIMLSQGSSGIIANSTSVSGGGVGAITCDDFNQDGKADLVVGGSGVFMGTGNGNFNAINNFYVSAGTSYSVVSADLDANGYPDLVTATSENLTAVQLNWGQVGIDEYTGKINEIKIFPNPSQGIATITSKDEIGIYFVYNVIGQKVMSGFADGAEEKINISAMPSGVYIIQVKEQRLFLIKE